MTAEPIPTRIALVWRRTLIVMALGVMAFSLTLVLLPALGEQMFFIVYYGLPSPPVEFPPEAIAYIRFANGVLGAVMIGWMTLILRLVTAWPPMGERALWLGVGLSLAVWFVIDTIFSVASGVPGNVLLNLTIAVGFTAPLVLGLRSNASGEH